MNRAPRDLVLAGSNTCPFSVSKTAKLPTGAVADIPRTGGSIFVEGDSGGVYEIVPPRNAVFYCFHKDAKHGLCVVVTYHSRHKIDNRRDWVFTVNWETGVIKRLKPWV